MTRLTALIICLFAIVAASAQTRDQRKAMEIKYDDAYYWGEGFADSHKEAKSNAINDLISKISVTIDNKVEVVTHNDTNGADVNTSTNFTSVANSYSQATLNNMEVLILAEEPEYHIFCYISKAEMEKIYDHRRDKIDDLVASGLRAEHNGKIDVALKDFYWAYALLKSVQYPNEVRFTYDDPVKGIVEKDVRLINWLPERINDIFSDLSANVTEVKDNNVMLFFTYKKNPVTSLDFSYYNGVGWTPTHKAKDGLASIDVRPGVDPTTLKIQFEYKYRNEANNDKEVASVVTMFEDDVFASSEIALSPTGKELKQIVSKEAAKQMTDAIAENNDIGIEGIKDYKPYEKVIQTIIKAVDQKDKKSIRQYFTDEGWDMMDRLLNYGKAKVLGKQEYSIFELPDGRMACRSVTMQFAFPNNHKTFTEDVVFTFDTDKLIEGVTFGLGTEAKNDVFTRGLNAEWSDASMFAIVDFLENYKTAFALGRIDYLESIFDDNAYIISGHVVKKAPQKNDSGMMNLSREEVIYTQYSKDEYIQKLRKIFKSNEYVNIQFDDNNVVRMGKGGEMYSIQIHQNYYSSNYGDIGYLYLLVDINDARNPVIKVRYWQPDRNPDLNTNQNLPKWDPDYGIIGPGHY